MSKPFNKLNFSLPFSMETAVPVDYNSYFTTYAEATAAAAEAQDAGSSETIYYIGQIVTVVDNTNNTTTLYQIGHDHKLHDITHGSDLDNYLPVTKSISSYTVKDGDEVRVEDVVLNAGSTSITDIGLLSTNSIGLTRVVNSGGNISNSGLYLNNTNGTFTISKKTDAPDTEFTYELPSYGGTLAIDSDIGIYDFSSAKAYDVGDLAIYDNAVWKCISGGSGNWSVDKWRKLFNLSDVQTNTNSITSIESKIPSQATSANQLADKDFVNSSISTNTAYFLSSLDYVEDLHFTAPTSVADVDNDAIGTALDSFDFSPLTASNNDYCFVKIDYDNDELENEFRRFKYNGEDDSWLYEYTLNNSSFTANQWASINSGITAGKVSDYDSHLADTNNPHNVTASQVGVEEGAEVNIIESVKVNGCALTVDTADRSVNVTVPVIDVKVNDASVVDASKVANITVLSAVDPVTAIDDGHPADAYLTRQFVDDKFYYSTFFYESSGGHNDSINGASYIVFKPEVFALTDGAYIEQVSVATRNTTSDVMPLTDVYLAIVDASTDTTLDTSDGQDMYKYGAGVMFTFSGKSKLDANSTYRLEFRNSSGELREDVGLQVYDTGTVENYYIVTDKTTAHTTWRPLMRVYAQVKTDTLSPFIPKTAGYSITDAGAVTKYLAATVNGKVLGGIQVVNSKYSDSTATEYGLGRIENTVNGVNNRYSFTTDKTDPNGVARFGDVTVTSVNSKTGAVVLNSSDVGAVALMGGGTVYGDLYVRGCAGYGNGSFTAESITATNDIVSTGGTVSAHSGVVIENGAVALNSSYMSAIGSSFDRSVKGAIISGSGTDGHSSAYELVRRGDLKYMSNELPMASTSGLGVVKIGSNVGINSSGEIYVNSASTSAAGLVQLNSAPITNGCTYNVSEDDAVTPFGLSKGLRYIIVRGSSGDVNVLDRTIVHSDVGQNQSMVNLPTSPSYSTNLAKDFIVDIENSGSSTETVTFSGFKIDWAAVVEDGYEWDEMMTIEPGVKSRFYFTETGFITTPSSNIPVYMVARQDVRFAVSYTADNHIITLVKHGSRADNNIAFDEGENPVVVNVTHTYDATHLLREQAPKVWITIDFMDGSRHKVGTINGLYDISTTENTVSFKMCDNDTELIDGDWWDRDVTLYIGWADGTVSEKTIHCLQM